MSKIEELIEKAEHIPAFAYHQKDYPTLVVRKVLWKEIKKELLTITELKKETEISDAIIIYLRKEIKHLKKELEDCERWS